jgi:hypothetical protein
MCFRSHSWENKKAILAAMLDDDSVRIIARRQSSRIVNKPDQPPANNPNQISINL